MCQVLEVSRTAYYRYIGGASYKATPLKEKQLAVAKELFWDHKRRYGSRRLLVELREQGHWMGRHRVRGLMKQQGLVAIQAKSFVPPHHRQQAWQADMS